MATLPTVPSFAAGDSSLTKLTQLAAAVSFCCRCPVIFHLYKTATQAVSSTTETAIIWDAAMADSDSGWSASHKTRYTAQTAGYYHLDYGVNGSTGVSDNDFAAFLQITTGAGNPGGAGNITSFAHHRDDTGTTGFQMSVTGASITPYLYVADFVEVVCFSTQATTVSNSWNTSGNNDPNGFPDGGVYFTGCYWSEGP